MRPLRKANLRINTEICHLFKEELRYLGLLVSARRIHTDPEKIAAILNMPNPHMSKQVHSFLGLASWYRRFVPKFTELAQPLYNLVKKGTKFNETKRQKRQPKT